MEDFEVLKRKYKQQLSPFFELLLERRIVMSMLVWDNFVNRFEDSVLKSPDQYLADLQPREKEMLKPIVKQLFEDFREFGREKET